MPCKPRATDWPRCSIPSLPRFEARRRKNTRFSIRGWRWRCARITSIALLLTAELLEDLERYALATEVYDTVPRDDPSFHAAELGRADALRRSGREDAAIEVLRQLTESHGHLPLVHVTLGDTLRGMERFEEANKPYNDAIALIEEPGDQHWIIYFARGITFERLDRWDEAEADFRKALELRPDQPQVLNYLGYSMLEMQVNLEEALGLIEKAVEQRPDSGYIIDSLGWGLYPAGTL